MVAQLKGQAISPLKPNKLLLASDDFCSFTYSVSRNRWSVTMLAAVHTSDCAMEGKGLKDTGNLLNSSLEKRCGKQIK